MLFRSDVYRIPADPTREHVVAAAVKVKNGDTALGYDHDNARGNYARATGHYPDLVTSIDGFVTSKGRFLTREEAMQLVRKNAQLVNNPPVGSVELDAADLILGARR